jgi:hypothetical protein
MKDQIKKDIEFYRKFLIPKLTSKGDAGYKSSQIAAHLERFIANVEKVINGVEEKEEYATPEQAEALFNA